MANVHITGYHTCKTEGGWSYIRSEAPFLSGSGANQWLTQGYYFWTDSDYFAHKWGKSSYNNDYAILRCLIVVENDLLLDIVGSTKAQIYFKRLLTKFESKLKKIDPNKKATIHAIIAYWRKQSITNKSIFPFVAIKAQDVYNTGSKLNFIEGHCESMAVDIQRQQLCLFEEGVNFLQEKEITYPENFKN